jgi:hypothetical protein
VGQGKVAGFFTNVENSDKLGGLAEDIRDAIMDYQVGIRIRVILAISNICTRPHYSKISMTIVVCSLWVPLPCISFLPLTGV